MGCPELTPLTAGCDASVHQPLAFNASSWGRMVSVSGLGASSDQGVWGSALCRWRVKMDVMEEEVVGVDHRERAVDGVRLGWRA